MLPATMRAARLHEYGASLQIDEVPTPRPGQGQVVVRVTGAGFCHSDLHVISGAIPILPAMPHTLGHENAGVVAACGAGVNTVKEGDTVAVYGGWGCGSCDYCVSGEENVCLLGQWVGLSRHQGGYAEFLLVPNERYLIKLNRLDPKVAAPLTDAALTPYRAIARALPVMHPDYPVLVIGAGGLGQFAVKLLRLLTPAPIIAADVSPEKLDAVRALGAHHVINNKDDGARERILQLAPGGVAAAFDFVGADATLALAAAVTRRLGRVVHVGLGGGTAKLAPLQTWQPEITFAVSFWGNIRELREVLALADDGRLTSIDLDFEPLDRINEVRHRLESGQIRGRAVITP